MGWRESRQASVCSTGWEGEPAGEGVLYRVEGEPTGEGMLYGAGRCPYLDAVFTFETLATVVRHLVADEVGLPVEGLGTLVAFVLTLLRVDNHVLLQAVYRGWGITLGSICLEEKVPYPIWLALLCAAPGRPHHAAGEPECKQAAGPYSSSFGDHWE